MRSGRLRGEEDDEELQEIQQGDPDSEASRGRESPVGIQQLGKGAAVALVGRFGGRALQFVCEVLLARGLGPGAFGVYAIGRILLRIFGLAGLLGLHNGVVRFGAGLWPQRPGDVRRLAIRAAGLSLGVGSALTVVLVASAEWWSKILDMPQAGDVVRIVSLAVPIIGVTAVLAAATRVSKEMSYSVIAEDLIQPGANLLLITVAFASGGGLLAMTGALSLSFLCSLGAAGLFVWVLTKGRDREGEAGIVSTRELVTYSLPTALAGTLGVYVFWVDRLVLGYLRTASEVGVYQSVSQVAALLGLVLTAFNAILAPIVSDLFLRRRIAELEELYRAGTKWGLYLGVPAFLTFVIGGAELIRVLFGSEYVGGSLALGVLAAGQLVNLGTGTVGILLIMTGNQNRWLAITSGSLLINLCLNLILVPEYGVLGAAIATSIAVAGMSAAGIASTKALLGVWPYTRRYLKGTAAAMGTAMILLALQRAVAPQGVLGISLLFAVATTVFFAGLGILGLDPEDHELFAFVKRRARGAMR